jgi:hypothetical protein
MYFIGINKYAKVKEINILLNAGLLYSFKLKGNSIKLQFGDIFGLVLCLIVFISRRFINDAIKTPPK